MVGIVVVSHSRRLAEGVAELATQMTQGKAKLAIAAGIDDPENPIGTDAIAVMEAIEQVHDQQGVVVLMDLGSALLSTEMALDLIDDHVRENVTLISLLLLKEPWRVGGCCRRITFIDGSRRGTECVKCKTRASW